MVWANAAATADRSADSHLRVARGTQALSTTAVVRCRLGTLLRSQVENLRYSRLKACATGTRLSGRRLPGLNNFVIMVFFFPCFWNPQRHCPDSRASRSPRSSAQQMYPRHTRRSVGMCKTWQSPEAVSEWLASPRKLAPK